MKYLVIIFSAFMAAVVVSASDVAWGTAGNGLSLGIAQTPDGKALHVYFRNETTDTLYILTDELWWRCDLQVDDKRIAREDDTKDLLLPALTVGSFIKLEPGAVLKDSVLLSRWATLPAGDLRLRYSNVETEGKEFGLKAWMGTVLSGGKKIQAAKQSPRRSATARPFSEFESRVAVEDPRPVAIGATQFESASLPSHRWGRAEFCYILSLQSGHL
jgi:hypothetical protein